MSTRKLYHPAPNRDWFQTPERLWASRPWTKEAVLDAKRAGAWFAKAHHEFADVAAARAAGVGE